MDIFIDNDEFATQASTLDGIIEAARQEVSPRGRIIVEIRLDGRTVPDADLPQYEPMLADTQEVQLITACPLDLSIATLEQVRAQLGEAQTSQQAAADAAATDDTVIAMNHVRQALAAWQQAQEAVQKISALLALPLDQCQVDDQPAGIVIDELAVALARVREQLVGGDWIGLADTLRHDLHHAAAKWQRLVDVLVELIEKKSG